MAGAERHVILDTDIGSDVDDALALGALLNSPGIVLDLVTTTYGDTLLRARLAARLAALAGHLDLRVVPGARETLAGRDVWWAGHEGSAFRDLDEQPVDESADAAAALAAAVLATPGTIDVFAIGPLTNIALALRVPGVATAIRRLYIMGGRFATAAPEHNLRSDPEAAAEVFASGATITVTGLEITTQVRLESEAVAAIAASGPLGAALDREIRLWWAHSGKEWNHPHDPVAVLTALRPELFEFRQGRVSISLVADEAGRSTFEPDPSGPVSLTTDLDVAAVGSALLTAFTQTSSPSERKSG